jgi:hypothetical protein
MHVVPVVLSMDRRIPKNLRRNLIVACKLQKFPRSKSGFSLTGVRISIAGEGNIRQYHLAANKRGSASRTDSLRVFACCLYALYG